MALVSVLLFTFTFFTSAGSENADTKDVINNLYSRLIENYRKEVIPKNNDSSPMEVEYQIALRQLLDIDIKKEKLTTLIWQRMFWTDEFLTWNPEEHGNISSVRFFPNDIFVPDIIISNSAGDFEPIKEVTVLKIIVKSDGKVSWYQPLVKTTSCRMFVKFFPYDVQTCYFNISSWTHPVNEIKINSSEVDIQNFLPHNQWILNTITVDMSNETNSNAQNFTKVSIKIQLKRQPHFYEMNLVIPTALVSGLVFLGFLLPSDSGEKVGFGITVFLSLCVNLLIISDFLPASSTDFPVIGKYYLVCIFMVAFSLVITMVVLTFHHHGSVKPIPDIVAFIVFDYLGPCIGFSSRKGVRRAKISNPINWSPIADPIKSFDSTNDANIKDMLHSLKNIESMCASFMESRQIELQRNKVMKDWQYLARILDTFSAMLFFVINVGLCTYFVIGIRYFDKSLY